MAVVSEEESEPYEEPPGSCEEHQTRIWTGLVRICGGNVQATHGKPTSQGWSLQINCVR